MSSSNDANPVMRRDNLVTTETGSDLLVYDQVNHSLHTLNAISAAVWRLCDGTRSAEMIATETGFSVEAVHLALGKLLEVLLIERYVSKAMHRGSRRSVFRKGAIAGVAAVPVLFSVTAPSAAHHESGHCSPFGTVCFEEEDCCNWRDGCTGVRMGDGSSVNYCGGVIG